jgi:hypothetical protein
MKKMILLVLVLALIFSVSSFAGKKMVEIDDGTPTVNYDNCITTNVWPWLIGFYNVGYERMIGSSFSVRPRATYIAWSVLGSNFFTLGVDLFWHPMGKGIDGWFLGPRYDAWIASSSGVTGVMNMLGLMGGYNIVFPGGFVIEIALGVQKNISNSVTTSSGTTALDLSTYIGTLPAFDLAMGWAF